MQEKSTVSKPVSQQQNYRLVQTPKSSTAHSSDHSGANVQVVHIDLLALGVLDQQRACTLDLFAQSHIPDDGAGEALGQRTRDLDLARLLAQVVEGAETLPDAVIRVELAGLEHQALLAGLGEVEAQNVERVATAAQFGGDGVEHGQVAEVGQTDLEVVDALEEVEGEVVFELDHGVVGHGVQVGDDEGLVVEE